MRRREWLTVVGALTIGCGDEVPSRFRDVRRIPPRQLRPSNLPIQVANIGTSHTQNADQAGWRRQLFDFAVAQNLYAKGPDIFVGTRDQGPGPGYADDDHDGEPGDQLVGRRARVAASYGEGKAYERGRLIITESWTNDLFSPAYVEATYLVDVAAYFVELRAAWPMVRRIIVINQWAVDPTASANAALAAARTEPFNAGLAAAVAAFNSAVGQQLMHLIDAYNILGADPTNENHIPQNRHLTEIGYGVLTPHVMALAQPIMLLP